MNRSEELNVAIDAAKVAGDILQDHYRRGTRGSIKTTGEGNQGLVTAADLAAERAISEILLASFSDHAILAEEEHADTMSAEHLWVVDPLDGTNNFAHGIPHYAVSIAYYRKGIAQCGVVYDPSRDDWFTCEAGQGSWHNNQRVNVNSAATLDTTMIATGFYYDRGQLMRRTLSAMERFFESNVQGVRRFGAASLDLVGVGVGWYGGYFEYTLSPWDFAAARLFVEQAGGKVTDCEGKDLKLEKTSVLATNTLLHVPMLEVVREQ